MNLQFMCTYATVGEKVQTIQQIQLQPLCCWWLIVGGITRLQMAAAAPLLAQQSPPEHGVCWAGHMSHPQAPPQPQGRGEGSPDVLLENRITIMQTCMYMSCLCPSLYTWTITCRVQHKEQKEWDNRENNESSTTGYEICDSLSCLEEGMHVQGVTFHS